MTLAHEIGRSNLHRDLPDDTGEQIIDRYVQIETEAWNWVIHHCRQCEWYHEDYVKKHIEGL
jgi:hypothetical protein